MPPHSAPRRRAALRWGAACVVLVAAGLAWRGGMLGYAGAEIYGHAWVQWWHGLALPAWPDRPGDLLPTVAAWPVIDPVPTALGAALGRGMGMVAGWNLTLLAAVALAALGGAAVARRAGGDPAVGAVALALAPALQGAMASGLTEDAFVGVAALALAGVGHRDPRVAVSAGGLLGLTAWCGLVLAWTAGLAALLIGLQVGFRHRDRWPGLVGAAAAAALVVSPVAWAHAARLSGRGHRMGAVEAQLEPLWRLNPWRGVDLLSLFTPGRLDPDGALVRMHPGYLGLTLLALAALAGRSRWWAVLALTVGLALGLDLAAAGAPLGLPNPVAHAVAALPLGGLLNHHGRVLLIAAVALAALAARGATRLPTRLRPVLPLLVLADLALLSPIGLPLPTTAPPTLGVHPCLALAPPSDCPPLPPGAVLHLPAAGPGVHFQRPLLLQVDHGRPIVLDPNAPGLPRDLAGTDAGRWLGGLAFDPPPPPPERIDLPDRVAVIVVEEPYVDAAITGLGPPTYRRADSAAWSSAAWSSAAGPGEESQPPDSSP